MWSRGFLYALFGALSLITALRTDVWLTDRALWADAVAKAPQKPRPHLNLGRQLDLAGEDAAALRAYKTVVALSLRPVRQQTERDESWAAAETNIAHVLLKQGQTPTAMRMLDGVIARWPTYAYAHFNRGIVLRDNHYCDDATKEFVLALQSDASLKVPVPACLP